ncbi:MAG: ATP synthase F1 subunit gamma [Clostridiales bacterium]|nr:ATP synthase F1 subunit gamma [Clostridiales bacterium]
MAGLREIQSRIKSIQDTRKITNAMYMISSTKMKKAKQELEDTEPYFYTLQATVDRILRHLPEMEHIYFESPETGRRKTGLLVITGDKGLAGAYNHNVLKLAQQFLDDTDSDVELFVVGELGRQYFAGRHIALEENFQYTAQNPSFSRARWITAVLLDHYGRGDLNELHVIYTRMENSMQSVAEDKMILPLKRPSHVNIPMDVYQEEFVLLPSAEEAVDTIVPNYLAGFVYGALVESFCSEQNARMMAMEAATNNADELLHDLQIMYNRARQAAITQEITEVCSGARAQKKKQKRKKEMHV